MTKPCEKAYNRIKAGKYENILDVGDSGLEFIV